MRAFALLCLAALMPGVACATALERLEQFMSQTQSARGEFEQRIYDRNRRLIQQSSGTLAFLRPGKFRWSYAKPYPQLIVGDGERVWIYDEDLQQVTVRKLDAALGATPAALLAGNNDAMKAFDLRDDGREGDVEWLIATPRNKESNFERIRIGFSSAGLARMELIDAFGQTTDLRFIALDRTPGLDPGLFRFVPPPGADVIGDR
ncbi:MAG: outer membrane lipoprotein chaperone LolA [Betaproteobacteria bacterium]|jgi:outer membrane lipoprotein carrier protein|nr:outer membrane lipoprotein chaperone LolA [Betaproteobacteria bacterium]